MASITVLEMATVTTMALVTTTLYAVCVEARVRAR
jgi:hypothetical protein